MKIFLDDVRDAPDETWTLVRSFRGAEALICPHSNQHTEFGIKPGVSEISLDHDLGEDKTGYDIVLLIEKLVNEELNYLPPKMIVHSANPVGRANMEAGIRAIWQVIAKRVSERM